MNTQLPSPIAAYFQAANLHDIDALAGYFANDAVVSDEEHEYRGAAIKEWLEKTNAEYQPKYQVKTFVHEGDKVVVTAEVRGTFPGSPIELRFHFTLRDDNIVALTIGN